MSKLPRIKRTQVVELPEEPEVVERLAYGFDEIAASIGVPRTTLEALKKQGCFPRHIVLGRRIIARPEWVVAWLEDTLTSQENE